MQMLFHQVFSCNISRLKYNSALINNSLLNAIAGANRHASYAANALNDGWGNDSLWLCAHSTNNGGKCPNAECYPYSAGQDFLDADQCSLLRLAF